MVKGALEAEWRGRMESFARAGKSVRAWCTEHEIPEHQFHYWRRRLTEVSAKRASGGWLTMAVVPEAAPGGIAIRVGRAMIEVQHGFDEALLRAVVHALENRPC